MTVFLLDISHIAEAIFSSLSSTDRLSCLLINHAWHDALIPFHWRAVTLFRRKWHDTEPSGESKWIFSDNLPLTVPHEALIRNSRHIRALSCNGPSTLSLLASSGCTHLTELCFIVDDQQEYVEDLESPSVVAPLCQQHTIQQGNQGLSQLSRFIASSSHRGLRAISIENVTLRKDEDMESVLEFVKSLESFPGITGFHIGFHEEERNQTSNLDLQQTLAAILEHRLDLIQSSSVHSLQICCGRIRNGWRFASHIMQEAAGRRGTGLDLWSEGRFLCDSEYPGSTWSNRCITVIENNGVLEIVLPLAMTKGPAAFRLRYYPSVKSLSCRGMIKNRTAQFMSDIPIYLPALREVDMDVQNSDANVLSAFIQDPHLQLSSVSLRDLEPELFTSFLNPLLRPVRSSDSSDFLRCALVRLTTRGGPLALSHVLDVLATCPNLQDLAIYNIGGYGPKSEIRHPWVCQLRSLTLGFNKFSYGPNDEPADVTACMLMEHLGKQILLQRLLVYYVEEARNSSCFPMELNLESQNGLTQLSRLSNLESFSLLGVDHHMERSEIDWMAVHWPRLRIMEVSPMNAVDENGPIDQDQYAERLSSYWPTFPRLNIDIVDWY